MGYLVVTFKKLTDRPVVEIKNFDSHLAFSRDVGRNVIAPFFVDKVLYCAIK